jgi:peroxiredoxin
MRRSLFVILVFLAGFTQAQQTIEGRVKGLGVKRVYLMSLYGERAPVIDSTFTDSTGHFRINLATSRLPGVYRVQWSKEGLIDVIWNRENVVFSTTNANPEDSLVFPSSLENRINLEYSRLDRTNQSKLELLMPVVDYYPVKDRFYQTAVLEMEKIQNSQTLYLDSLIKLYPDYYSVRMARVYRTPFLPASLSKEERVTYMKQHYFDKVDFADTALLHSLVFANKAISYLALYSNNRLPQKQLQTEFIKAVTIMLSAASVNPEVYKYLLDYLVGGFDKYHFDDVIEYIAENFQDPFSCEDQQRKTALQKKLETFKKIAVGKTAPEIEAADSKEKPFRLSVLKSEYTLLVFWSTQCQHCTDMMPKLKAFYEQQKPKKYEVVAVSVDTSRSSWTGFIKTEKLNWMNVSDLKGFAGKVADDFNIYATPTMFLLDRDKKILAKPISMRELEQVLRDQKLL